MAGPGGSRESHIVAGRGVWVQSGAHLDEEPVRETRALEFSITGVADPRGGCEVHVVAYPGKVVKVEQ